MPNLKADVKAKSIERPPDPVLTWFGYLSKQLGDLLNLFQLDRIRVDARISPDPAPGQLRVFRYIGLLADAQLIKPTAGNVYGYHIYNGNATNPVFVKLLDTASPVVAGSNVEIVATLPIPAKTAVPFISPHGTPFDNGLSILATTGAADANAAAPGAGEVIVNIWYA